MTNSQENKTRQERVEEANESVNLFLSTLRVAMKNMDIAMGWDRQRNKLVLLHNKTKMLSRIDLEELNGKVFTDGEDRQDSAN